VPSLAYSPADRAALLAALLARGARKQGRHWRVRCLFPDHADQHPSCDVDLDQMVFVCRSCHRGGGYWLMAELLGVTPGVTRPPPPAPPEPLDPMAEMVEALRRWRARVAPSEDRWRIADWVRHRNQLVTEIREYASSLGDTDEAWTLLAQAATISTETAALEADLLDGEEDRDV
jgi:hypothetical protein